MKPRLQFKLGVKLRIAFHALSHSTDSSVDLLLFRFSTRKQQCSTVSINIYHVFLVLPHRNDVIGIPHMSTSNESICRLRHVSFLEDADGTGKQQTLFGT